VYQTKTVVTPILEGFINIEGGEVGIASKRFADCEDCLGTMGVSYTCKQCGRSSNNYLKMRSGFGDGIYPVYELSWGSRQMGSLCIFDDQYLFTRELSEIITQIEAGNMAPNATTLAFWEYFSREVWTSFDCHKVGNLNLSDHPWDKRMASLYFSDSGENTNSQNAIVELELFQDKIHEVYSFGQRDPGNGNIFIPQFVLTVDSVLAREIGLPSAIDIDWALEAKKWSNSLVSSNIDSQNIRALALNVQLHGCGLSKNYWPDEDEKWHAVNQLTWGAQLFALGEYDDLTEGALKLFREMEAEDMAFLYKKRGLMAKAEALTRK
jgi:hypothetical protein